MSSKQALKIIDVLLSNNNIKINNKDSLLRKLTTFCNHGTEGGLYSSDNLGIITDFDRTITNGDSLSTHGIVERCDVVEKR